MRKYSEINVGDVEKIKHQITKEDIQKFVDLTGDDNKLHVDDEYAKSTQFQKPVVHGMLGASFISTVIGTRLPGDGALWFSQSLEFLLPVRIGDLLTIIAEVIKKNDKENIIELKTTIENQNRQIVTQGIAKVKVVSQVVENVIENPIKNHTHQTALIIGSTGGIGKATAIQLAKDGFNLILHYFSNKDAALSLKKEIEELNAKAICIKADILNNSEIEDLVKVSKRYFPSIDVLVNCAALPIPNIKLKELEWQDYQNQINITVKSVFNITKAVLPFMIENSYGKIVNIGSMAVDKPNNDWSHYITAKSALIGLTKSFALELAPKGICVNLVTPSLIKTDLTANIPEKVKLLTASNTPLRRLASVEDVANAISFLASRKSSFITGENIRLNGGQIMI